MSIIVLLWDSGFGKLVAFNGESAATSVVSIEREILFGFAVIVLQVTALTMFTTDRWMWLGVVVLGGLGLLTLPGFQPWPSTDTGFANVWAIASHLLIFLAFSLVNIFSWIVRHKLSDQAITDKMPELSWRQMIMADDVGMRYGIQVRQNSQGAFDRFYSHLQGNAANG